VRGETVRLPNASDGLLTPPATPAPPRQDHDDLRETIGRDDEVEEVPFESFPASDAPGSTGGAATPDGPWATAPRRR
jgi:hypothetical protein